MLAPSSDELIETPDRPERPERLSRPLLLTVGNFNDPMLDGIVPPVLWLERNCVLLSRRDPCATATLEPMDRHRVAGAEA